MRKRLSPQSGPIAVLLVTVLSLCGPIWAVLPKQAEIEPALSVGGTMGGAVGGEIIYLPQGRQIQVIVDDGQGGVEVVHGTPPQAGEITALARVGSFLVAAWRSREGYGVVSWFDLADPLAPQWMEDFRYADDASGLPADLAVIGDWLYLVDERHGLVPIDVSVPDAPVGHEAFELFDFPAGSDLSLAVFDDDILLVARKAGLAIGMGFQIVDVSSPDSMEVIAVYGSKNPQGAAPTRVLAGSDYAVLFGGLTEIVDLTDLSNPQWLADVSGHIGLLTGDMLVTAGTGQLRAWDLDNPAAPAEMEPVPAPWYAVQQVAPGPGVDEAVFFDTSGAMVRVDMGEPASAQVIGTGELPFGVSVDAIALLAEGVAVLNRNGWRISVLNDQLEQTHEFGEDHLPEWPYSVASDGEALLVVGTQTGVRTIDLTRPEGGMVSAPLTLDERIYVASDGHRFWAAGASGVHELDLSMPLNPELVSTLPLELDGSVWSMDVADGLLYLAAGFNVHIIAVPEQAAIEWMGQYGGCQAFAVAAHDTIAMVACGRGSTQSHVIDVADPAQPVMLAEYTTESAVSSVLLEPDKAWLGHGRGVDLVDLNDPAAPLPINRFVSSRRTHAVVGRPGGVWVGAAGSLPWPIVMGGAISRLDDPAPVAGAHTAAWYDPDRSGEGWMIEVLSDDLALGYWYTYDAEGNPAWMIGTGAIEGNRVEIDLYSFAGARFGSGFDPGAIESTPAGTVHLRFSDCERGWFRYQIGEQEPLNIGLERLTRVLGLEDCDEAGNMPTQAGQSGSWYDPLFNGQGFTVHRLQTGRALVKWFTYDSQGDSYWVIGTGEEQDGRLVFPELISGRGAVFGADFDPDDVEFIDWGELEMELGCLSGTAQYASTLPQFGSGAFQLDRLSIPRGLSCE